MNKIKKMNWTKWTKNKGWTKEVDGQNEWRIEIEQK